ncbi:unnamed protein product, partial [Meganyctiphanes norvegica]
VKEDNQFWQEAQKYCEDINYGPLVQSTGQNITSLLKEALHSKSFSSKHPERTWWVASGRVTGIWKWNRADPLDIDDSNLIYEYRCSSKEGYICEAPQDFLMNDCSPNTFLIALLVLMFFLLVIILGLGVYIFSLKRRSK